MARNGQVVVGLEQEPEKETDFEWDLDAILQAGGIAGGQRSQILKQLADKQLQKRFIAWLLFAYENKTNGQKTGD